MRNVGVYLVLIVAAPLLAQRPSSAVASPADQALLLRTRAMYDAPFIRSLVSFECRLDFNWERHVRETSGTVPPQLESTLKLLGQVRHRVIVDRHHAAVTAQPGSPRLDGDQQAMQLEEALTSLATAALDSWIPFATNIILPVGATPYSFVPAGLGYKLSLNGNGVSSQLLLTPDLALTGGTVQQPQTYRFSTTFQPGPQGLRLASLTTGGFDAAPGESAAFTYGYTGNAGYQLPTDLVLGPNQVQVWRYQLTDCQVQTGIIVQVSPPQ